MPPAGVIPISRSAVAALHGATTPGCAGGRGEESTVARAGVVAAGSGWEEAVLPFLAVGQC